MTVDDSGWEQQIAAAWASAGARPEPEVAAEIRQLVGLRSSSDPAATYELASLHDFLGEEALAAPLYRKALTAGLDPQRRPRAAIQLASTLRNLAEPEAAVALLQQELDQGLDDGLDDARAAFLALALIDAGRSAQAVALLLGVLAPHLTEYGGSIRAYAAQLLGDLDDLDDTAR